MASNDLKPVAANRHVKSRIGSGVSIQPGDGVKTPAGRTGVGPIERPKAKSHQTIHGLVQASESFKHVLNETPLKILRTDNARLAAFLSPLPALNGSSSLPSFTMTPIAEGLAAATGKVFSFRKSRSGVSVRSQVGPDALTSLDAQSLDESPSTLVLRQSGQSLTDVEAQKQVASQIAPQALPPSDKQSGGLSISDLAQTMLAASWGDNSKENRMRNAAFRI